MTYDAIIEAVDAQILKSGCRYYKEMYVGITNDVERRLFEEHHVNRDENWWIYAPSDTEDVARAVESHYLELGMRGGTGGGVGDGSASWVYCYVITPNTIE